MRVVETHILSRTSTSVLERFLGECIECHLRRRLDFDITDVAPGDEMRALAAAWPPPKGSGGSPYHLAERREPRVDTEGTVVTQVIAGRWAILGGRSGSMGSAYICADRSDSGRLCIVKLPRTPGDHDALRHEIQVYIKLCWATGTSSAHVLQLQNVEATRLATPWLVLDAVLPGPLGAVNVDDWIQKGLVTTELALAWMSHLATALQHCNLLIPGFVHGDLKPDNLLVDGGWILKLFDFGMSGDLSEPAQVGAPLYRAPELWEGGTPSPMSDVYSFGCIAYELLSGKPPFRSHPRDDGALEDGHRFRKPIDFPGLPHEVLACLDKSPEGRPTVDDLVRHFTHETTRTKLRRSLGIERDWNDAAAAYISLGQPENAAPFLAKLVDAKAGNAAVLLNLGIAASQGGLRELADAAFNACESAFGERPDFLSSRATHYFRNGDLDAALDCAERALVASPQFFPALITISAILNDKQRHREALDRLEIAGAIDSRHPALLYQLAYTYMMLGKCPKAKQAFDRLRDFASEPELVSRLHNLGSQRCGYLFRKLSR